MNRRSLLWWIIAGFVLVVLLSSLSVYRANHRSLHIETDASSLKFELNDQTYTINDKSLDISLKPGTYKYRAISTVDDNRVVLTDTVNLTTEKSADLHFNFSIYNDQAIMKAICGSLSNYGSDSCPFRITITRTDFAENYQWAVVWIDSPDLGKAAAVLRVDNGRWKVVDGPATDINTGGYFPESVERIIENGQ
jgi:hypothetical protein